MSELKKPTIETICYVHDVLSTTEGYYIVLEKTDNCILLLNRTLNDVDNIDDFRIDLSKKFLREPELPVTFMVEPSGKLTYINEPAYDMVKKLGDEINKQVPQFQELSQKFRTLNDKSAAVVSDRDQWQAQCEAVQKANNDLTVQNKNLLMAVEASTDLVNKQASALKGAHAWFIGSCVIIIFLVLTLVSK